MASCQYCKYGTTSMKPFDGKKPDGSSQFQRYASYHVRCARNRADPEEDPCPGFELRQGMPESIGALLFPDFPYYKLNHGCMAMGPGNALAPVAPVQKERAMHSDILQAAMSLFRADNKAGWTRAMIWSWYNYMPDYFFTAPASATRKYHPGWASRPDGLLLHSLAVTRVFASLSDIMPDLGGRVYNAMVFAGWHHDMFKYGALEKYTGSEMTVHEHPVLAGDFFKLKQVRRDLYRFNIEDRDLDFISGLIATHAGPYRSSHFSSLKLPECTGQLNTMLYKADYIASRKETDFVKDVLAEIPDGM